MPILKSAKKKMRQDKLRKKRNNVYKNKYKKAIKTAISKNKSKKSIQTAFSAIDKAAKVGVIKKNKAARLKSRITKVKK